jgi:hypothetical protein
MMFVFLFPSFSEYFCIVTPKGLVDSVCIVGAKWFRLNKQRRAMAKQWQQKNTEKLEPG